MPHDLQSGGCACWKGHHKGLSSTWIKGHLSGTFFCLTRTSEDEMAGWHHQCNGHELGQTLGDSEGQGGLVCCSPYRPWVLNCFIFNHTVVLSVYNGEKVELLQSMMDWPKILFTFFLKILWENANKLFGQPNITLLAVNLFLTVSVWQLGMTDKMYSLYHLSLVTNLWAIDYVWLVSPNVDNWENIYKQKTGLALRDMKQPGQARAMVALRAKNFGLSKDSNQKGKRWGKNLHTPRYGSVILALYMV